MSAVGLFEETFEYTRPIDGQYPRPWMTNLQDPTTANCFVVGMNQARGFRVEDVGSHRRHVDALFNREGESCRGLYDSLVPMSPTRRNIDRLARRLRDGGARVLETNVICVSTPMSADLTAGQRHRGAEIFCWLLDRIRPGLLIVHGDGARRELQKLGYSGRVIAMPSLAPPAYNKWHRNSEAILDEIAARALSILANG